MKGAKRDRQVGRELSVSHACKQYSVSVTDQIQMEAATTVLSEPK